MVAIVPAVIVIPVAIMFSSTAIAIAIAVPFITTVVVPSTVPAPVVIITAIVVAAAVISYHVLVVAITIVCISCAVVVEMVPGISFIEHHFITRIQIVVAVTPGQVSRCYPAAVIEISELPGRHAIVCFDIGQVIIFCIIVAAGTPFGLCTDVYTNPELCIGFVY